VYTRYGARKEQFENETEKVNWLFAADLSTMGLSISEKSGLVKLDLGLGRRNPNLYANEILAILDKGDEIRRYLQDHPQAKNTPPTKKQLQAMEQLTKEVVQAKEKEAYRQALVDAGLKPTDIDVACIKRFGSV